MSQWAGPAAGHGGGDGLTDTLCVRQKWTAGVQATEKLNSELLNL